MNNNRKMTNGHKINKSNSKPKGQNAKREQPKKDSRSKRVNFDNAREDKVAKQIMSDAKSGKFNDINDFLRNPTLLKAAASYPVFPILGEPIDPTRRTDGIPGIMAFNWVPSFGDIQGGLTRKNVGANKLKLSAPPLAINQASDSTYSFIVHDNSRNYNYNSSDLFMLIIAGANVFGIIESMKRAYGMAKIYTETNRYYPDAVLEIQGFNAKDLKNHLSQAWFDINNLIVQTRQIWVPNAFPIVTRWMDINSNLYKDAPGDYAQTYIYVQSRYFTYNETQFQTGSAVTVAQVPIVKANGETTYVDFAPGVSNQYTWSQWVAAAQGMIDNLINSEDRGIIYGDLLNAYTAERIIAIPEINSDYTVIPEYSPEISMQIENTVVCPKNEVDILGLAQYENKLYPMYNGGTTTSLVASETPTKGFLNFHIESDPSPEMILTATRFMTLGIRAANTLTFGEDGTPTSECSWIPNVCGSEIVQQITICNYDNANNLTGKHWTYTFGTSNRVNLEGTVSSSQARWWFSTMAFDWHPFAYTVAGTTHTKNPSAEEADDGTPVGNPIVGAFGDADKYTIVEPSLLKKINDVAFYSLFGVPQI